MSSSPSIWFRIPKPNSNSVVRLFCFPYAGTGPIVYREWSSELPTEIEVCSILLPGRENRIRETPFTSIQPLIAALLSEIKDRLDRPYVFFGHSLGALIAFELSRELQRLSLPLPTYLFLSGRRAPGLPDPYPPLHELSDARFVDAVQQRYNGIPKIILQEEELLALFLPTLRADFSILETYKYTNHTLLETPIVAFGGLDDPMATEEELTAWREYTNRSFYLQLFPGDHFFVQEQRTPILQTILSLLISHFPGLPGDARN